MVLVGEFQAKKVYLYMEYVPIPIKTNHCPFQGGKNSIKLGDWLVPKGLVAIPGLNVVLCY